VRDGEEVWLLRGPENVVATWREGGHQCILTAPAAVPDDAVLALAARSASRSSPGYDADG
jgi:hypothetical protein